jgi:hypothetical protein
MVKPVGYLGWKSPIHEAAKPPNQLGPTAVSRWRPQTRTLCQNAGYIPPRTPHLLPPHHIKPDFGLTDKNHGCIFDDSDSL